MLQRLVIIEYFMLVGMCTVNAMKQYEKERYFLAAFDIALAAVMFSNALKKITLLWLGL